MHVSLLRIAGNTKGPWRVWTLLRFNRLTSFRLLSAPLRFDNEKRLCVCNHVTFLGTGVFPWQLNRPLRRVLCMSEKVVCARRAHEMTVEVKV